MINNTALHEKILSDSVFYRKNNIKQLLLMSVIFLAVFFISVGVFGLCNRYDNKYAVKTPQASNGILVLNEDNLDENPVNYLIYGWEIYRDRIMLPADFETGENIPDEYVFIGQYGGFEGSAALGENRSPHGCATYRMNIVLPDQPQVYSLDLPEVFSAYKLYINGRLMKEIGSIDYETYYPKTDIDIISFEAAGEVEIIITAADYSHTYSGMVYPPAFGESGAIMLQWNTRFFIRTAACIVSLGIGFLYLLIAVMSKGKYEKYIENHKLYLYVALCFVFTMYICYVPAKILIDVGMSFYTMERFSFCAMLLLIILIQSSITKINKIMSTVFTALGGLACVYSLVFPIIAGSNLKRMIEYSRFINAYMLICVIYLSLGIIYSIMRGSTRSWLLLAGMAVFDAAIVMDRLNPSFEPILVGWFTEIAGGVMVILIGITMSVEIAMQLRLRQAVEARMESVSKMLDTQKAYYPIILQKEREIKEIRHDMRHQVLVIQELLLRGEYDKLKEYVHQYAKTQPASVSGSYCKHFVMDMLLRMYAGLADQHKTQYKVLAKLPDALPVSDVDLCVIISNVLENALEATQKLPVEKRLVEVRIGEANDHIAIVIKNSFDGNVNEDRGRFFSRKKEGRLGVGIDSVRSVVAYYNGRTIFYSQMNTFFSEVLIPLSANKSVEKSLT